MSVKSKLLDIIEKSGLSYAHITKGAGVNNNAIYDLKSNKSNPKKETVEKFAKFFNIQIEYFYDDEISSIKEKNEIYTFPAKVSKEEKEILDKLIIQQLRFMRKQIK